MNAAVSFGSDELDVGHHEFVLAQTSADAGSMDDRLWYPDTSPDNLADKDNSYKLTNIRQIGNTITADGPGWFMIVPKVKFVLSAATASTPSIHVVVTGAPGHNEDVVYPLSKDDYAAIVSFLRDAKFPA